MKVTEKSVVKLTYNLSDESGKIIDSSDKNGSLIYVHGVGMMMPGIEKAIDGEETGFQFSGTIEAADAYGEYKPENVVSVPRVQFEHLIDEMEEGKLYNFDTGNGASQLLKVVKIDVDFVTVDSNHPYAGETLSLECTVEGVRPATEEEVASLYTTEHAHEDSSCGSKSDSCTGDKNGSGCGCDSHGSESCGCNH